MLCASITAVITEFILLLQFDKISATWVKNVHWSKIFVLYFFLGEWETDRMPLRSLTGFSASLFYKRHEKNSFFQEKTQKFSQKFSQKLNQPEPHR